MNSLLIAQFLFDRVTNTIKYKEFIKEVEIGYDYSDSFGNSYIKLNYWITLIDDFKDQRQSTELDEKFLGKPYFVFPIYNNSESRWSLDREKLLLFIEFRNIYESLAAIVALQFGKDLDKKTIVKIKGIDFWPYANYAEKYLSSALDKRYFEVMNTDFESDIFHWNSLNNISNQYEKIYSKEKKYFKITDLEIYKVFRIDINDLRSLIISNNIPIKVKGKKLWMNA